MTYDPAANSLGCYNFAIRALRHRGLRQGRFEPLNESERAIWCADLVWA